MDQQLEGILDKIQHCAIQPTLSGVRPLMHVDLHSAERTLCTTNTLIGCLATCDPSALADEDIKGRKAFTR